MHIETNNKLRPSTSVGNEEGWWYDLFLKPYKLKKSKWHEHYIIDIVDIKYIL